MDALVRRWAGHACGKKVNAVFRRIPHIVWGIEDNHRKMPWQCPIMIRSLTEIEIFKEFKNWVPIVYRISDHEFPSGVHALDRNLFGLNAHRLPVGQRC